MQSDEVSNADFELFVCVLDDLIVAVHAHFPGNMAAYWQRLLLVQNEVSLYLGEETLRDFLVQNSV